MARKYVDCREFPQSKCSVVMSADTEEELIDLAMQHGVQKHGFKDDPKTREDVRKVFKTGCPTCD